jgi:hypothetical protein
MKYDVRYQIGGEEESIEVEADDAAMAASIVQEKFLDQSELFELIQVHLLDEFPIQEIEEPVTQ